MRHNFSIIVSGMSEKQDDALDLNDAETRRMLHNPAATRNAAIKAGIGAGLLSGLIGGIEALFMIPEFVRKYKSVDPQGQFTERLATTVKQNKLLTGLVLAPAMITAAVGTWGFFSARSTLKKKEKELCALEKKEAQTAPSVLAEEIADTPADTTRKSWVERSLSPAASATIGR